MKRLIAVVVATIALTAGAVIPAAASSQMGPTAKCRDGTYSYAVHHQGACSHHGGVARWYK